MPTLGIPKEMTDNMEWIGFRLPARRLLFALVMCALPGCDNKPEETRSSGKHHRAILFFDEDMRFQMDYEGTGLRQLSLRSGDSIEFKAMHLEHGNPDVQNARWVDASFQGTVTTSGEEGDDVRISLKVDNKVDFEIQTMGITPKGSENASEPIPHAFSPGHHELLIEGKITDVYEKQR